MDRAPQDPLTAPDAAAAAVPHAAATATAAAAVPAAAAAAAVPANAAPAAQPSTSSGVTGGAGGAKNVTLPQCIRFYRMRLDEYGGRTDESTAAITLLQ